MVHRECANGELFNASLQNSQTPDGHCTHRDCPDRHRTKSECTDRECTHSVLPVSIAFVGLFDWGIGPFSFRVVSCMDYR